VSSSQSVAARAARREGTRRTVQIPKASQDRATAIGFRRLKTLSISVVMQRNFPARTAVLRQTDAKRTLFRVRSKDLM